MRGTGGRFMNGAVHGRSPSRAAAMIAEILELADQLRLRLDAPCESQGVSPSRFAVMSAVHECGEDGCSQTDLATKLGLSESNVSVLVEGMRKAGLLFRFRSKVDRRRSVLLLTEAGSEMVSALIKARDVVACSLIDSLGGDQLREIHSLLRRLTARLDEAGQERRSNGSEHSASLRRAS